MIRALFVTHSAAPSGAELATARLVGELRDIEVAMAFAEDGPMVERLRTQGAEAIVLPGGFDNRAMTIDGRGLGRLVVGALRLVRLGWTLGALARRDGSAIVVAESTKALVMGAVAARRARIPIIWQVHDRISGEYFGRVLAPLIRVLGWLVADGYLANSRSTLSTLITWRRRSLVAYPGIAVGGGGQHRSQRGPSDTVVAVVGRLSRWKGQDVFLRALAEVTVRPARVYLVGGTFFGEEPYREELRCLVERLRLPVTFTGHVDDPGSYMRQADILVHCSVLAEPFGQVVAEGMNAGCAVIASRPGGTTEIVRHRVNGLLVDGGDRAQLTAALDELIGSPELRRRLSAAARRRAAAFDIADSARDVSSFLHTVVAGARREQVSHA